MSDLPLPECLKGPWDHALILTYGMDLPFFEQTILREFPARCRNRIVLADGQHFLDACTAAQRDGLARAFNHRYVAEGVYAPHAAHAKLILLANAEQGRLLVGSGNLSWQGYASGGELFTQYEYTVKKPEHLAAFLAVRELLQGLLERRYLSDAAERYVQLILAQTPWLYYLPTTTEQPVRHNLTQNFLQQLQQEIGDESVEELIVLSPFYDEHCRALERMLAVFQPDCLTMLVQRKYTSVDPAALQRVLNAFGGKVQVRPVQRADGDPYLHAKLVIIKQRQRAVCLQGSPNLSQAALLLTDPQGNIELANLLHGPRDSFDHLLTGLELEPPVKQVSSLGMSYQPIAPADASLEPLWYLTAASWNGTRLRIEYRGQLPDLKTAAVVVGQHYVQGLSWKTDSRAIECKLPDDASTMFTRPIAVRVQFADSTETNPVFVCNIVAIDALLAMSINDDDTLGRVSGLDLDDQELETLLGLLEDALMLDQRSVWQTAGRQLPQTDTVEDEALNLKYADIDYAMLRQHPRVQQYMRGLSGGRSGQTRLQVILSAISRHFLEILDRATQATQATIGTVVISTTELTEEELEGEDAEPTLRSWSQEKRTQRLLKAFIRRYLRGVTSKDFREFAGAEVLAQNYIIFSHILWRIWLKGWVEEEFLIEAMLTTWTSFWGDADNPGSFCDVDPAVRAQLDDVLREHHTVSTLLAALSECCYLTQSQGWEGFRIALRDFWRAFLTRHIDLVTLEVLEETWYHLADVYPHETPTPLEIIRELTDLTSFDTESGFLRSLEQRYRYPAHSCRIEHVVVNRENLKRAVSVECVVIEAADGLRSAQEAEAVITNWMQFKRLDYYRIVVPASQSSQRVALYEVETRSGVFWDREKKQETELKDITPSPPPWSEAISDIRQLATQLKVTVQLPQLQSSTIR